MPDYAKINGIEAANIVKIDGVERASVAKCNGISTPATSTGATRWAIAGMNGNFSYAAASDLTSWTNYDSYDEGSGSNTDGDGEHIAFGKNGSGAGIYIATRATHLNGGTQTREIHYSSDDITSTSEWTNVDIDNDSGSMNVIMHVHWGARSDGTAAGTWMAVGKQASQEAFRSIDGGATWSAIDLSGLSGHDGGSANDDYLNAIASDGQGNWMFTQDNRIYSSTNDGASFAVSTPFSTNAPGRAQSVAYTIGDGSSASSWVVAYSRSSKVRFRSCDASDITDWGSEVDSDGMTHTTQNGVCVKMAAGAGHVVAITEGSKVLNYFTVDGKTIGTINKVTLTDTGQAKCIATDGHTFVIGCRNGDLWSSTIDDLSSWTQRLDNFNSGGDIVGVTCDVVLPV